MSTPKPTDGELAILAVLWQRGPSTVRQVFEVLNEARDVGYTRHSDFSRRFPDRFRCTPGAFRKRHSSKTSA